MLCTKPGSDEPIAAPPLTQPPSSGRCGDGGTQVISPGRVLLLISPALLALAACAGGAAPPEPPERIITVPIAVPAPCVAEGGRPAAVPPINRAVPPGEWRARAPGAKAQTVRAQAGRRMNREDRLDAATAGCS